METDLSKVGTQRSSARLTRWGVVALLMIATAATLLMLPVFIRGFPNGFDIKRHYPWSYYFCAELAEGILYPRWLAGANHGYGSPVMFYYPPLEFYIVAAFKVLARNLLVAIELSCWLSMVLSGLAMYHFNRSMWSRRASMTAAVLYMAAPYHFLDLYRVNALAEYWSFVWIPLVLEAARRLRVGQGWRASAYLAVSYGLLLLTHVPTAFIVTLLLPIYLLALRLDKRMLLQATAGLSLGVGISAAFLVSVVLETKYVRIDRVLEIHYEDEFLFENFDAISWRNILALADYPRHPGYIREANLVVLALALLLVLLSLILWAERKRSPVVVNNGEAQVQAIRDEGLKQSYSITAKTQSTLTFRSLYFPGWIASVVSLKFLYND